MSRLFRRVLRTCRGGDVVNRVARRIPAPAVIGSRDRRVRAVRSTPVPVSEGGPCCTCASNGRQSPASWRRSVAFDSRDGQAGPSAAVHEGHPASEHVAPFAASIGLLEVAPHESDKSLSGFPGGSRGSRTLLGACEEFSPPRGFSGKLQPRSWAQHRRAWLMRLHSRPDLSPYLPKADLRVVQRGSWCLSRRKDPTPNRASDRL